LIHASTKEKDWRGDSTNELDFKDLRKSRVPVLALQEILAIRERMIQQLPKSLLYKLLAKKTFASQETPVQGYEAKERREG